jgi:UDP-N-acetylglucosamine--N-acetylmuramyl-(pentapeptide) pyrophosphoryl-undecaprenol N-acetylglucosamine transferase
MKILFTGGGTGGHFYPIIAVAEEINKLVKDYKLLGADLYYISTSPYNEGLLFENGITFKKVSTGKLRIYFSLMNFIDIFRTILGVIVGTWEVFKIYPDVIFSKGAYASFPVLFAGRLLGIPIVIHESDSAPGRVNAWAGKFADRIATSYKESADFFPKDRTSHTGNPVRSDVAMPLTVGAYEFLNLDPNIKTILILGGSQGSEIINEAVIEALPNLLSKYQIIHQTGKNNIESVKETAKVVLGDSKFKDRYKPFDYLNLLALRMSAGVASLVISRAGSTIFEIASWAKPSILIPITNSNANHQRLNAYNYSRTGAGEVIEEKNLTANILIREIDRLMSSDELREKMSKSAKDFFIPDAARKIATEILNIAIKHEK